MKTPELESLLKRARLPEVPEESAELFPRRVLARLQRGDLPERPARGFRLRLGWVVAAAVGVALAFGIGHWRGRTETETALAQDSLANLKLIQETLALFPNRVRAIVQDERGLNLVLSDHADVPASPPIWVKVCAGERCTTLVTFSGQELGVGGQKMTVLSEAEGGVLVLGDNFVWSSDKSGAGAAALQIQARQLRVASAK